MATPVKTVQFRSPDDLVSCYSDTGVAAFAIKDSSPVPRFKYEGDNMDEGTEKLKELCRVIIRNKSAGIYTLCLYEDIPGKIITEKTMAGYAWNFRFFDHPEGMGMVGYNGGGEDLRMELSAIRKDLADLKKEREEGGDNRLGVIGDILQIEAIQPILMGIAQKIADWVMSDNKVGELKRVSGIPLPDPLAGVEWSADERLVSAISRLYKATPDLCEVLTRLANVAEKNPKKFALYLIMVRKLQ